jgi:hypothetical protein
MKCYKCGKEAELKRGICIECYKEQLNKKSKNKKKHSKNSTNFIISNLTSSEKILDRLQTSKMVYAFVIALLAISTIFFPRTIMEFFFKGNTFYFLALILNILLFFLAIYSTIYFMSREIYLTNKRILGQWGLFKLKTINLPLNNMQSIDELDYKGLEIVTSKKTYKFDLVANNKNFKLATIEQIKKIIDSTDDEKVLISFSHSLNEKLEAYKLKEKNPNMTLCKCCKKMISKDSISCIHCGQPVLENERSADLLVKAICFILPPVGFILFLLNIGPYQKFAKQCLLSSIFSLFFALVIYLSLISIL